MTNHWLMNQTEFKPANSIRKQVKNVTNLQMFEELAEIQNVYLCWAVFST